MSNSTDETLEDERDDHNSYRSQQAEPSQAWETMARAWVSAFPEAKAVSPGEVETWIGSNLGYRLDLGSLPADLRSMPRSELIDRLLSIQHYMRPSSKQSEQKETATGQPDHHPARFQRTDQWLPVYSWLESLDHDELVKSKDINNWLDANPEVKEELFSRHSRYHLTHYIKKCHLKILKRKEKKGLVQLSKEVHKDFAEKQPMTFSVDPLSNIPKDSDLYRTKQKEAQRRFEILVELEKRLAPHFSRPRNQIANR
ncbi:PREDICTED: LOW QUALITY PROTEIN: uncharacterized protein LOC104803148 [Tarenaya hassleriana]|uniref:LOW QUALITY PROTEIN: uncharacterized protein LOC104803148 n=1 Tax=Tarenaya hassleriana TaxID=28532 RepID=UPI00053C8D32|nr:PREDICTED: LOW QUALITY PROTEIN: uncharacterized protein LOC104803148 [Tarenaya hassleriana]